MGSSSTSQMPCAASSFYSSDSGGTSYGYFWGRGRRWQRRSCVLVYSYSSCAWICSTGSSSPTAETVTCRFSSVDCAQNWFIFDPRHRGLWNSCWPPCLQDWAQCFDRHYGGCRRSCVRFSTRGTKPRVVSCCRATRRIAERSPFRVCRRRRRRLCHRAATGTDRRVVVPSAPHEPVVMAG
jgi:hypothetical protein